MQSWYCDSFVLTVRVSVVEKILQCSDAAMHHKIGHFWTNKGKWHFHSFSIYFHIISIESPVGGFHVLCFCIVLDTKLAIAAHKRWYVGKSHPRRCSVFCLFNTFLLPPLELNVAYIASVIWSVLKDVFCPQRATPGVLLNCVIVFLATMLCYRWIHV